MGKRVVLSSLVESDDVVETRQGLDRPYVLDLQSQKTVSGQACIVAWRAQTDRGWLQLHHPDTLAIYQTLPLESILRSGEQLTAFHFAVVKKATRLCLFLATTHGRLLSLLFASLSEPPVQSVRLERSCFFFLLLWQSKEKQMLTTFLSFFGC